MRPRHNPFTDQTAYLAQYLNGGVDTRDFAQYLSTWFEETGRKPPKGFDPDEPYEIFEKKSWEKLEAPFKSWCEDTGSRMFLRDEPALAPAYLYFSGAKIVPPRMLLVHFSDDAESISREGFIYGHEEMQTLGLTVFLSDRERTRGPGWNFAFFAQGSEAATCARTGKYGKSAVLFRAGGVSVYHSSDEENQVIFWGETVRDFVLIDRDESSWTIAGRDGDRVFAKGTYREVFDWVDKNEHQYRRQIVRSVAG